MMVSHIYHEKQEKELCALHSLNNLFQERVFTKTNLDDICLELSPDEFINPHRGILRLGNYNINVIMRALQVKNCEAIWFDKRKPITILNFNKINGFIVNLLSDSKIAGFLPLPWKRKHWIAIKKVFDVYYNLDSKLEQPEEIGDTEELQKYFQSLLKEKETELFVIVTKEIEQDETWRA